MHFHALFSRSANDQPPGNTSTFLERLRRCSRRWHVLHGILIAQLILMPCPPSAQAVWIEVDTDGDGIVDSGYDDGTPDPNAGTNPDPQPDPSLDSDGDGLTDAEEAAAGSDPYCPDSDYDGLTDHDEIYLTGTNPLASDSNGNGISDYNEFYGNYTVDPNGGGPPESPYDHDGDGIADPVDPDPYSTSNDPDSDGDSIADSQDTDPYNTMVWCDYNRNGVNDDAETQSNDQDGDGVSNETDSHPYDPALSNDWNWNGINDQDEDWDGDGVSNLQDSHPNSNTLWCDWNSNGVNDDAEAGSMDSDGDGHPDASDSHPYYSALWNDWNNNGTNDEADSPVTSTDSDADGHADNADSHPSNSALWEDWNNNGVNDSQESTTTDSDSDGIEDGSDSDPGNPSLWSDWNHNGVNDGDEPAVNDPTQQDSDADGHVDAMDSHPGSPGLWEDWNFNDFNDSSEAYYLDSDGDGTSDALDTHPGNPGLWNDENSNGVNDGDEVVIVDTDGDGYADPLDTHPGDAALYNDHDNNGTNDEFEAPPDDDADAIPDSQDPTPDDQDNDGVTDTEEYLGGTNPGEVDTDGDGLADGMEAYAGTDPLNVDTDGDGLTDFEELMAYHTDPLSATGTQTSGVAGGGEDPAPAPGEETPPGEGDGGGTGGGSAAVPGQAEIDVRLVVDAVTQEGFDIRQGSLVSFPSTSTDQSDLKKTFVIQNSGSAPLSGLQLLLTGADQAAFEVSVLASDTLSPGGAATFTLTFKASTVSATRSLRASLLIASNDTDESSYELQLFSVSGFWHAQRAYFFADLSDGDHDGIPDRVEDMYAPLVVTPDGDLDGDGVSNLTQYLSGLDIRGGGPAGDFDGDEISDAVEDSWSRHSPGALNKYRFRDAFQDPDGDGLLTIEEIKGWWGGRDDPAAVATHPFKNCTGPNNAGTAPSYNVAVRTPPLATGTASDWFNRESELSAWMNDGLLRLACRERGSSMTVAAFFASRHRYKKPGSSASYGYDHLPAGYLAWLGLNAAAIPATTTVLPAPPADVAERIAQRKTLLRVSDPDLDGMPSEWEAVQKFPKENAFCLDWRNPSDASLPAARTFLQQQIAELTQRIQDLDTRIATAATTARLSLINQRTLLEVERMARQQVLDSRLGSDGQTGAVASPHSAMMGTGNVHQTLLMEPYLITAPKAPAALASPPAETATAAVKTAWDLKRDAWVTAFTDRLQWEILSKIDPDHDGLVNADEYLLGLSPRLPDYTPTGGRDTDGDGFTDAQELTAGTNHLDRTQFPPFTLHVISGSPQVVKIHQELPQALVLEARGADGTPQPGIALTVTTSLDSNLVLLSGSDATDDWWPKTLQTTTGTDGRATIRVKAPNTAVTLRVTATATLKTTTKVTFSATVSTPIGDVDGDGMPDAWETKAAQNGQPAHALNKSSAKDASAGPLHFGYHRDTPTARLTVAVNQDLQGIFENGRILKRFPAVYQASNFLTKAQWDMLFMIDPDHDGISNLDEYKNGTNPRKPDNLFGPGQDFDGDGFSDLEEKLFGTDIFSKDNKPELKLSLVSGGNQKALSEELLPSAITVRASIGLTKQNIPLNVRVLTGDGGVRLQGEDAWQTNLDLLSDSLGHLKFQAKAGSAPGAASILVSSMMGAASLEISYTVEAGTNILPEQPPTGPGSLPPASAHASPKIVAYLSQAGSIAYAHGAAWWGELSPGHLSSEPFNYDRYTRRSSSTEVVENFLVTRSSGNEDGHTTTTGASTENLTRRGKYFEVYRIKNPVVIHNLAIRGELDMGFEGSFSSSSFESSTTASTTTTTTSVPGGIASQLVEIQNSMAYTEATHDSNQESPGPVEDWGFTSIQRDSSGGENPIHTFITQNNASHPLMSGWSWKLTESGFASETGYTMISSGVPDEITNQPEGNSLNVSGTFESTTTVEFSEPLKATQIYAGMLRGIAAAEWSAWQPTSLGSLGSSSASRITEDMLSASASLAQWKIRYELPQGMSSSAYDPVIIRIVNKKTLADGTSEEEVKYLTLNPGEETEAEMLDASGEPGSILTANCTLLPVEIVQGELGTSDEDSGNWLMTEANPKPEVEMAISNAHLSGGNLTINVQGTVKDRLSKYAKDGSERVTQLRFFVDGVVIHSISLSGAVSDQQEFNESVTIPNAMPRGYTLRAETTPNAAGNTGWDQVAVGLNLQNTQTGGPSGGNITLSFSSAPSSTSLDTVTVSGIGGLGTLNETAASSGQYTGTVNGEAISAFIGAADNLSVAETERIVAKVVFGGTAVHGTWEKTGVASLTFVPTGYQGGGDVLTIGATVELPGSQKEEFKPITFRVQGPADWAESDEVKVKIGTSEYQLKEFSKGEKIALYPFDEAFPDEPKQFLPSNNPVPTKLQTLQYTPGGGELPIKLVMNGNEHEVASIQVEPGTRTFMNSTTSAGSTASAPPKQGWKQPGDTVTRTDLLTAYEWIYGGDEMAMTLLNAFLDDDNIIRLKDVWGNLDVNGLRIDQKIEIEIEHDDGDINPVACANLLYAGLYRALAYPPLNAHPDVVANWQLVHQSRQAFARTAAEITATGVELYLSGISIAVEPLDWVLVVNDVAKGQVTSLAAALPFVPAGALRTGRKIAFHSPAGEVLGEITNAVQLDAIQRASRKRAFEDKVAILEQAGVDDGVIKLLVYGGELQYAKAREVLKDRMKRAGNIPPSGLHQAHHDFPWEFREWFAAHKIDVNDAQYGRWSHPDDHKRWHNENPKFNDVWEEFIFDSAGNATNRSKQEILEKLSDMRSNYQATQ